MNKRSTILSFRTIVVLSIAIAVGGCSTPGVKQVMCIAAGSLVGGAAGYYATDESTAATVATAVIAGAIGGALCKEPEPAPAPKPVPKPAPKPTPPPAPKPDPDSDGDGVKDSLDECPGTAKGTPVDSRGCPEIPNLQGVHFEFDKARLTAEAMQKMDEAAGILERNPHVRAEIVGHTDSIGSNSYNQTLSEKRANAVRDYLASKGIGGSRLSATGLGESAPIAVNDTKAGRAQNRRVEITARPIE